MNNLELADGSRVGIIGGGPAGSFFAFFLQKFAQQKKLKLGITIFDAKDFLLKGPRGCNLCAGVISETLSRRLHREGIRLPEERIIHRVDGYCLHQNDRQLFLTGEGERKDSIATVFRGNGPRYSSFPETVSFDDFLLTLAQDSGAVVLRHPVRDLELASDGHAPVRVLYGAGDDIRVNEFDLVVGAFGVNSSLSARIKDLGFGYKPPATLKTFQAELKLNRKRIEHEYGNYIHVHMPRDKNMRYVTLIPKGDFLSVAFVGRRDLEAESIPGFSAFLGSLNPELADTPHCTCFPRIVVSAARKPYADRLVLIGDASCSRYYKNGIESALVTAELAARTAVLQGIDSGSFANHYHGQARKTIIRDNRYGRILFFLNDVLSTLPGLQKIHIDLAADHKDSLPARTLHSILWNMFTGNQPYKSIFRKAVNPKFQLTLLARTIKSCFSKGRTITSKNPE
jgi:flavin-dependent dehydrogenase